MSRVTSNLKEAGYEEDTNSWANLWSDGQKSHMRLCMRIRLQDKPKSNNYTESCMINEADIWRGRNVCEPEPKPDEHGSSQRPGMESGKQQTRLLVYNTDSCHEHGNDKRKTDKQWLL